MKLCGRQPCPVDLECDSVRRLYFDVSIQTKYGKTGIYVHSDTVQNRVIFGADSTFSCRRFRNPTLVFSGRRIISMEFGPPEDCYPYT